MKHLETGGSGSLSSRPDLFTQQVPDQPWLFSENLFQKTRAELCAPKTKADLCARKRRYPGGH